MQRGAADQSVGLPLKPDVGDGNIHLCGGYQKTSPMSFPKL